MVANGFPYFNDFWWLLKPFNGLRLNKKIWPTLLLSSCFWTILMWFSPSPSFNHDISSLITSPPFQLEYKATTSAKVCAKNRCIMQHYGSVRVEMKTLQEDRILLKTFIQISLKLERSTLLSSSYQIGWKDFTTQIKLWNI